METPASHLERIARDGYTILERVIEPELVYLPPAPRGGVDVRPARNPFEGAHTVRIYNLLVHGKLYEQIPVHERVLPIVEGVLDPGCLVSFLSSISIDPGERASAHAEDVQNLRDDELVPEGRRAGRRAGRTPRAGRWAARRGRSPRVPPPCLPAPRSRYAGAAHEDLGRAAALVEIDRRYDRPILRGRRPEHPRARP